MYKIILYKNCIVTSSYTEVFRSQQLLDSYLGSLINKTTETEIFPINYNIQGTIKLTLNKFSQTEILDLFTYNYMKITSTETRPTLKLYMIITNIRTDNTLIYFDYIIDCWHTYMGEWSIRYGLLTNCLRTNEYSEIKEYDYPLDYITNKSLTLHKEDYTDSLCIIAEMSIFDLATAGQSNSISNWVNILGFLDTTDRTIRYTLNQYEVDKCIQVLTTKQNKKELQYSYLADKYYFKIVNLYVVPFVWVCNNIGDTNWHIPFNTTYDYIRGNFISGDQYKLYSLYEYTLLKDKKIRSYGFFSSQFSYNFNNNDMKIKIYSYNDNYNFKLYINSNDGFNEITNLFKYELNFDVSDASVLVQQEIEKKLQNVYGMQQKVNGYTDILAGTAKIGLGATEIAGGFMSGNPLLSARGGSNIIGGFSQQVNGITNIDVANTKIESANKNKYINSFAVNNENIAIINAMFGICYLYISNNDILNKDEVDNITSIIGYKVNTILTSIKNTITDNYDVLKFNTIVIRGCNTNVNDVITSILTNGVKIWYTATIE